MTKKDFIELARGLRKAHAPRELVELVMDVCQRSNPRFDRDRFEDAVYRNEVRERPNAKPRPLL